MFYLINYNDVSWSSTGLLTGLGEVVFYRRFIFCLDVSKNTIDYCVDRLVHKRRYLRFFSVKSTSELLSLTFIEVFRNRRFPY